MSFKNVYDKKYGFVMSLCYVKINISKNYDSLKENLSLAF